MSMITTHSRNSSISRWNHSLQQADQIAEEFDNKINEQLDIKSEEIKNLKERNKRIIEELTTTLADIEDDKDRLSVGCFSFSAKKMNTVLGLSIVSGLFMGGGALATFFSSPEWKFIGLAFGLVGAGASSVTTWYTTRVSLNTGQRVELGSATRQELQSVELFDKFLTELDDILEQKKEADSLKGKTITQVPTDTVVINIPPQPKTQDDQITSCLGAYESSKYQKSNTYCRVVSVIVQTLPQNDDLKQGLNDLAKSATLAAQASTGKTRNTNYLPNSKVPVSDPVNWKSETESHEQQSSTPSITLSQYSQAFAKRFKLRQLNLSFVDTPEGLRITEKGVTVPKLDSSSEKANASNSRLEMPT